MAWLPGGNKCETWSLFDTRRCSLVSTTDRRCFNPRCVMPSNYQIIQVMMRGRKPLHYQYHHHEAWHHQRRRDDKLMSSPNRSDTYYTHLAAAAALKMLPIIIKKRSFLFTDAVVAGCSGHYNIMMMPWTRNPRIKISLKKKITPHSTAVYM